MILDKPQLKELANVAELAAKRAAEIIRQYQTSDLQVEKKQGMDSEASSVVTQVDLECQETILEILDDGRARYDLGLLTEELKDDQSRLKKDYFWCIDPLDGTLPFTENRPGYAVSIALVSKTGIPVIGVINDPATHRSIVAIKDQGIKDSQLLTNHLADAENDLMCYFDRSFLKHEQYDMVVNALGDINNELSLKELKIITGAGAVINAMSVFDHKHSVYFKFPKKESGGGSLWDYAATACVFGEMNQPATDIHGKELNLNNAHSTFMNHAGVLFASSDRLAELIQNMYKSINR